MQTSFDKDHIDTIEAINIRNRENCELKNEFERYKEMKEANIRKLTEENKRILEISDKEKELVICTNNLGSFVWSNKYNNK